MRRLEAIDYFRGFAILLMILVNYMGNVLVIPPWLKHADDIGYTIIDLIAPMFVFAMGLTNGLSFGQRLERDGAWNTYQHFLTRYLALLGLGYLFTLGWELSGIQPPSINWGLLQALGAAGLITCLLSASPLPGVGSLDWESWLATKSFWTVYGSRRCWLHPITAPGEPSVEERC